MRPALCATYREERDTKLLSFIARALFAAYPTLLFGQRVMNARDHAELLLQLGVGLVIRELGSSATVPHRDALADEPQRLAYSFDRLLRVRLLVVEQTYLGQ